MVSGEVYGIRLYRILIISLSSTLNTGSYVSAHVLLNLLNVLGEKIKCEAVLSILSVFPNEFNKFNNTVARMQDSIYHMALKPHFISKFCIKTSRFRHWKTRRFYGRLTTSFASLIN